MNILFLVSIVMLILLLNGCTTLTAVGTVGRTINNAVYNAAEHNLNNPQAVSGDRAQQVATANLNLAAEYLRQGNYETALVKLNQALKAKSDFAPAYNVRGLLYQRLGDPDEAERNFKRAIKLEPDDSSALNNYGLFLCNQGRTDEALDAFMRAANNPLYELPEIAYSNAGICLLENDLVQARTYFTKALGNNGSFAPALLQMARFSYDDNQFDTAYDYLRRYKSNARQTPSSLLLGIRITHQLGFDDETASMALLLKNRFPNSDEAQLLREFDL